MQDRINIYFDPSSRRDNEAPRNTEADVRLAIAVLGICFFLGALTTLGVIALVVLAR